MANLYGDISGDVVLSTDGGLAMPKPPRAAERPIDRLAPQSELHRKVLERLRERQRRSADKMSQFYGRWNDAEHRYQAYLATKEYDQLRKASAGTGKPPEFTTITVPYTYATVMTIITYLVHTFCGNKPMFQVDSYRPDVVERAQKMETMLQFNADHIRLIRRLYQYFHDGETYGLQVTRITWRVDEVRRSRWSQKAISDLVPAAGMQAVRESEPRTIFEGNDVVNIDPYAFFPDPNVPMDEVAARGEYVFWRHMESRTTLLKAEKDGLISHVRAIPDESDTSAVGGAGNESARGRLSEGDEHAGLNRGITSSTMKNAIKLYQGSVEIVPSEWGLGEGDYPEKWLFTWANDKQIIQAEPLDADHNKHPVIVGEPYSTGYAFGNFAVTDMLAPMQDTLSWLINSHVHNVRAVLNNELIVQPQMIDINDLKKRGPGRVIKMLPAAFGQDPKLAIQQLAVQDVTQSHIQDMAVIQRLADQVSAVNDNLRGLNQAGGRKTATEVRTSGESGASRLACHAMLISAQSMCPMAEMMSLNLQQNLTQDFYMKVVGADGAMHPLRISPDDVAGDFYYPVSDGTLPMDRTALMGVWKEIFMAIVQNAGLAQLFNVGGIFEYIAKLGGAKNITNFKLQTASPDQVAAAIQSGNAVPANTGPGGGAMPDIPLGPPPGMPLQ